MVYLDNTLSDCLLCMWQFTPEWKNKQSWNFTQVQDLITKAYYEDVYYAEYSFIYVISAGHT